MKIKKYISTMFLALAASYILPHAVMMIPLVRHLACSVR